ncbi:MAG: aminodeoxychorismate synthase component I [Coraliomargaritaceae bacterium]
MPPVTSNREPLAIKSPTMLFETIHHPPSIETLIDCFGAGRQAFVLDSAQSNNGMGQWSFFGSDPYAIVEGSLDDVQAALAEHPMENATGIPFIGGAVGYLAYDYARSIEVLPSISEEDRSIAKLRFGLYDSVAALNHTTGVLHLIAHGISDTAEAGIEALRSKVKACVSAPKVAPIAGPWEWNMDRKTFIQAIEKIKDYIASGDVYQVNLSRRARCRFEGEPLHLYQALRKGNPGPYCAYLDTGDCTLLSTSPEQFLVKRGLDLATRPIKGTRPRGSSPVEDKRLAQELAQSAKERAELLMIVDLERNDLGRVAAFGSVHVEDLYQMEHYARVIHQTAQVKARLAPDKNVFDCIRALFPGGSITGAPKIRAMQVIEELEPTRRGAYCGSIGYIGFNGDAELNIAIRSLHLIDGYLDYQVGGGIVWDSIPEDEFSETEHKARAIHETIDAVCRSQP